MPVFLYFEMGHWERNVEIPLIDCIEVLATENRRYRGLSRKIKRNRDCARELSLDSNMRHGMNRESHSFEKRRNTHVIEARSA